MYAFDMMWELVRYLWLIFFARMKWWLWNLPVQKEGRLAVTKMILGCKKKSWNLDFLLSGDTFLLRYTYSLWVPYPFTLESSNIQSCMTLFSPHRGIISSVKCPSPPHPLLLSALLQVSGVKRTFGYTTLWCLFFCLKRSHRSSIWKGGSRERKKWWWP